MLPFGFINQPQSGASVSLVSSQSGASVSLVSSPGFSLQYYGNDYTQITGNNSFANITSAFGANAKPLYNGNISSMVVNIPKVGDARAYAYTYDQLNRMTAMDAWGGLNNNTNQFTPVSLNGAYQERITYDPNGNILTYKRNGDKAGAQQKMDELTYEYKNNNNQLKRVRDAAPAANYSEDIDDQPANNYEYDAIGNLIQDTKEGITKINWTVYGKIESISKTDGSIINYSYDAAGNRISKTVTKAGITNTTAYIRDAQGNVLSIYEQNSQINNGHFTQSELHLYGSSRLGIYNLNKDLTITPPAATNLGSGNSGGFAIFERGKKFFELSNHLGNVLATVSDEKFGVDVDNNGTIDYYTADVVSAQDYYPFGMGMPGRKFSSEKYRYGFNGKEKSNEISGEGNHYTAEYWEYDSRIGRRWNTDPVVKDDESSYMVLGNNPIVMVDPNGADWYRNKKSGGYDWFDGSGRHKGYKHMKTGTWSARNANNISYYFGSSKDGLIMDSGNPLPEVTVTAKTKVKHTLADKAFSWANFDRAAAATWRNNLYDYQSLRSQGVSAEEAGSKYEGLGATYERYYQAEQDWRSTQMAVFVDFPSLFVPIPKVGMFRWFGSATGRVFWSGGGVGGKAFAAATEHALLNGGTTLEMTTAGKLITKITMNKKNWLTGKIWEFGSRQFAKGAAGDVHMFMDLNRVTSESFWFKHELPILTSKGLDIITHIK